MKVYNPVVPTLIIQPAVIVKKKPDDPDKLKLWTPPSAAHVSSRYVSFLVKDGNEKLVGKVVMCQPGCFFELDIAENHVWFMWERDVLVVVEPAEDEEIKLTNGKGAFLDQEDEDKKNTEALIEFEKGLLQQGTKKSTLVDAPTIIIKQPGGITR